MLIAHGIAHLTHSFRLASYITLGLMLIVAAWRLLRPPRNDGLSVGGLLHPFGARNDRSISTLAMTATALILGLIYSIRDHLFGNPDRVHNANFSCIANNDFYPPHTPIDINLKLTDYHYGTDLMGATMKLVTGLSSWDAQSIQMGIWVTVFFISCTALISHYVKSQWLSLASAIFITGFSSTVSYLYLLSGGLEAPISTNKGFLLNWIMATWTSISSVNTQLRLGSQNMAIGILIALLIIIIKKLDDDDGEKNIFYYITTLILSFGIYFIYPSLFYPLIAAIAALAAIYGLKSISNKTMLKSCNILTLTALIFYLGKILTGTGNSSAIGAVKTLKLIPHETWLNWGKPYLLYYFPVNQIQSLSRNLDPVTYSKLPEIPLMSWISFVDFADIMLIAFAIAGYQLLKNNFYIKKKLPSETILILSSAASFAAAFMVVFLPRPIETTRFILWAKVFSLIFVAICLARLLEKLFTNRKSIGIASLSLILLGCIPGIAAVYPSQSTDFLGTKAFTNEEKSLIQDIERIHKTGNIVLDSRLYEIGATISNFAGFFGVGGQIFKEDTLTRQTALVLMSPRLLSELNVDYVLINPDHRLSPQASKRLADAELFEELTDIAAKHPGYHFYKFKKPNAQMLALKEPEQEHIWVLVYQEANSYKPAQDQNHKIIAASTRTELDAPTNKIKEIYAETKPLVALWIKAQAAPRSAIGS